MEEGRLGPFLIPGLLANRHIVHVSTYALFTQLLESGLALVTVRQPADRDADALLGQKWFDGTGCSCG